MHTLAAAIRLVQRRGTVVVGSAGNDGTCRPTYPAALPGVKIAVGAIEPDGPAPLLELRQLGPGLRTRNGCRQLVLPLRSTVRRSRAVGATSTASKRGRPGAAHRLRRRP